MLILRGRKLLQQTKCCSITACIHMHIGLTNFPEKDKVYCVDSRDPMSQNITQLNEYEESSLTWLLTTVCKKFIAIIRDKEDVLKQGVRNFVKIQ